jgi:hypothetical protein
MHYAMTIDYQCDVSNMNVSYSQGVRLGLLWYRDNLGHAWVTSTTPVLLVDVFDPQIYEGSLSAG